MTQQQVAEPADEPQAALIATCTCGRPIWRLALDSAKWRHDDSTVICAPPVVEEAPPGDPGIARATDWFTNGGRDDPPFDQLIRGDQP